MVVAMWFKRDEHNQPVVVLKSAEDDSTGRPYITETYLISEAMFDNWVPSNAQGNLNLNSKTVILPKTNGGF